MQKAVVRPEDKRAGPADATPADFYVSAENAALLANAPTPDMGTYVGRVETRVRWLRRARLDARVVRSSTRAEGLSAQVPAVQYLTTPKKTHEYGCYVMPTTEGPEPRAR